MPMTEPKRWGLGAKLLLVGIPFLVLGFFSIVLTLWMSWQLDGGSAAVNEAGRLRMQAYRMSLSAATGSVDKLPAQLAEFEHSLALLRNGDPERPLFVPWDETVGQRFSVVEHEWSAFRDYADLAKPASLQELHEKTVAFAGDVDALVAAIEAHMSRWTALLQLTQFVILALGLIGAAVLLYTGYLFVLEPVDQLKQAIEKVQRGDFGARVRRTTSDEFGTLAEGFNEMAERLQSMYRNLEGKVAEKTSQLEEKSERLESLYEVAALVTKATTLDELARGFVRSMLRIARADGIALRWSDQANQRYLMLASEGLPAALVEAEQCLHPGDCFCGTPPTPPALSVIPIRSTADAGLQHCKAAGFETVVNIPVRLHDRLTGEVDLFFYAQVSPSPAERSLLETLTSHLASSMENLRLNALEKEAAISQERNLLARELHDSIAQSLAFLKIQVQLMRDALQSGDSTRIHQTLDEIDNGVRESYGDVRELLVHFRTRTNAEDIEPALVTTLRKFEHQTGLKTSLKTHGQGVPMPADLQVQVLHIVQEALSNIRKHARATQVWLDVQQQPEWRFEVRDDGIGFAVGDDPPDETHVGLRIMRERAERIGARLNIVSAPGCGTSVLLTLPSSSPSRAAPAAVATDSALLR